jgi:hypothetical protein
MISTVGKGVIAGSLLGAVGGFVWYYKTSNEIDNSAPIKGRSEDAKEEKAEDEEKKDKSPFEDLDETSYAFLQDSSVLDILKHIEPYLYPCSAKRYKDFLRDVSRIVEIHQFTTKEQARNKDGKESDLSPAILYEASKSREDIHKFFKYVKDCYKQKNMSLSPAFEEEEKALIELLDNYNHNSKMEMQYRVRFQKT